MTVAPNDFVHLHLHTAYSLLDGACHVAQVVEKALELSSKVAADDGFTDFIANTTAGIYQGALQPDEQLLLTDKMTPTDFTKAIQAFYLKDLAG